MLKEPWRVLESDFSIVFLTKENIPLDFSGFLLGRRGASAILGRRLPTLLNRFTPAS